MAQDSIPLATPIKLDSLQSKTPKQKDIIDVGRWILRKDPNKRNDTIPVALTKPTFSVVPAAGYSLQTGLAAVLSGSVSFHTGAKPDQKLSTIITSLNITEYRQFIVPLQSSIWTKDNSYNITTDWRYMNYPSFTYGIGGNTKKSSRYRTDFSYLKFHQTVFKNVSKDLFLGVGYYFDYFWGIKESGNAATDTTLKRFSVGNKEIASGIPLRVLYDSRLNQANASQGFLSNIVYTPYWKGLGSQSNWQTLVMEFRKFISLHPQKRSVLALWSFNWMTLAGNPPFLLLPSTGWDDQFNTARGYIQGRFRAKNMFYLEAEYRFGLTHNGLLGGVLFANAQSFYQNTATDLKYISPGVGLGLRLKINKFSGSNLCVDYGFGADGSRGFFVNLNEVF